MRRCFYDSGLKGIGTLLFYFSIINYALGCQLPPGFSGNTRQKLVLLPGLLTVSHVWKLKVPASSSQPPSGEGLTPWYHSTKHPLPRSWRTPLEGPQHPTLDLRVLQLDMEGAMAQELPGSGSGLGSSTPSSTPRLEGGAFLPDPAPIMDSSQASFPYLHHRSAQPWLWAAQGSMIMPTL